MHVVQREDLDFSTVQPMVEGTKEALREIIVHPGPAGEEFFSSLHSNKFKGEKLFAFLTQKPAFDDMKSRYVGSLIDETDRRFPADTMVILSWFTILEPKKAIVAKQSSEFLSMVQRNLTPFLCDASDEEARSEFAMLKQVMVSSDLNASFSFQRFAETALHDRSGVLRNS